MFIDHLIMLFKRPEVEEKQFTYYGKPAQLEKYSIEVSGAVIQRMNKQPQEDSSNSADSKKNDQEQIEKIVRQRVEQELASNSAITRHQLAKAKLGEKYHVSALRRETEHVIEEQKQLLQTSTNSKDIDQELLKKASAVEAQVLTCYRDNKDRPLDCLEKVRELQSIARQLSLQQL